MPDAERSAALRVGVLGTGQDVLEWSSGLSRRAFEVIPVADIDALLRAGVGLGLVVTPPEHAAEIASRLAAQPTAPPVAMLIGDPNSRHPFTRLQATLLEAKNDWEGTFDAIVDPVAILDGGGRVVRANRGLAGVLGRQPAELIGQHYLALVGKAAAADPIAAALEDGGARTGEARYASVAATFQVTVSPLADGRGGRGLVVLLKDITVLKEQQERLLQTSRLTDIGQLAAGVAHEINTPLASIALRAESLLRAAQDPRLQEIDSFRNFIRYLKTIDEEIFRCKKIISALLEFSRRRPPEVRETDLNALAERAADLVGHQLKLKQIALALRLEPQLPHIRADDDQLRQALIALLMNAGDATPAGGRIEVETRKSGDHEVTFSVTDNGVGIPRENLDRIFSPFFTTKPVGQGTGLGLALCHGIVTAHGGAILVESDPGKGSRFSLVLPIRGPETPSS
jgi:two-component system NtrC family sensor kinase